MKPRFGQHFLERSWAEKVVRAIGPRDEDTFLEIGPGRGALTSALAARSARVVAFEIDRDLAQSLKSRAPDNLTIIEGDFLGITVDRLRDAFESTSSRLRAVSESSPSGARVASEWWQNHLRVAGNLPYNVASPILFKLAELYRAGVHIVDATVMLQREVADRLIAPPGGREYGVLSVLIGYAARVERLLDLPPGAFRPAPRVDSTVVRLVFHPEEPRAGNRTAFEGLVQAVFTRRRKTLANALLAYCPAEKAAIGEALERSGIDGRRRPETLQIAEFVQLSDAFGAR